MRVSLTKKIFLNFLILSIVPIIIIDTYFYFKSKNALIDRTFEQLTTVRIEKQNRLTDFFNQRFNFLETLTELNKTDSILFYLNKNKRIPKNTLNKFKKNIFFNIKNNNPYKRIIFTTPDNVIWCWNLSNSAQLEKSDTSYFQPVSSFFKQLPQSNNQQIFDNRNNFTIQSHSFFIGSSIKGKNDMLGSIILEISLSAINKIMYENNPHNGLGKTGETYLVGSDYYMRSSSRFKDNSIFKTIVNTEGVREGLKDITGKKQIRDYRNIPVLSSYSKIKIPGLNWAILAEIDTKEAMIPIHIIRNDIIFMSVILSILLLGLVEILSSKITAPIKKLKQATDKIRHGEIRAMVNAKSNDEIGDLIAAFNQMIVQLQEQSVRLKEERILRSKSLFDGQEIERQRLSRELHDSLGQSILALKMKFEQIREATGIKKEKIVNETENLFLRIMTEIRNISNNLMPAVLSEFGLILALKKTCREINKNTGININFKHINDSEVFDKKTEIHIYRIVQEAFSNTLKHANASEIQLTFMEKENQIELSFHDNGDGFIFNKEIFLKGNGLSNIKERINLLDGKLNVITSPKKGTTIFCQIPIYKS